MALVEQVPAWAITVKDETGSSSTIRGWLRPGLTAAAALSAVAGLVDVLAPITGCVITRYAISFQVKESPSFGPLRSDSIRDLGRFVFKLADPPATFDSFTIPVTEDVFVTVGCRAGLDIDQSLPGVSDLTGAISGGLWCDPFGADLDALCAAYRLEHV